MGCKGSSINDEKALCVFVHQMEDKNVEGLKALATKNEKADTLFFYATEDSGIAEQVVRLCDIKPAKGEATLVLLDLDDDGPTTSRTLLMSPRRRWPSSWRIPENASSSSRRDFVKPSPPVSFSRVRPFFP